MFHILRMCTLCICVCDCYLLGYKLIPLGYIVVNGFGYKIIPLGYKIIPLGYIVVNGLGYKIIPLGCIVFNCLGYKIIPSNYLQYQRVKCLHFVKLCAILHL